MEIKGIKTVFLISNEDLEGAYCALYSFCKNKWYNKNIDDDIGEQSISDAFNFLIRKFGWSFIYDDQFNVIDIKNDSSVFYSASILIFKLLAPYVVNDSYIEIDDGYRPIIWKFVGKKVKKSYGDVMAPLHYVNYIGLDWGVGAAPARVEFDNIMLNVNVVADEEYDPADDAPGIE